MVEANIQEEHENLNELKYTWCTKIRHTKDIKVCQIHECERNEENEFHYKVQRECHEFEINEGRQKACDWKTRGIGFKSKS